MRVTPHWAGRVPSTLRSSPNSQAVPRGYHRGRPLSHSGQTKQRDFFSLPVPKSQAVTGTCERALIKGAEQRVHGVVLPHTRPHGSCGVTPGPRTKQGPCWERDPSYVPCPSHLRPSPTPTPTTAPSLKCHQPNPTRGWGDLAQVCATLVKAPAHPQVCDPICMGGCSPGRQ